MDMGGGSEPAERQEFAFAGTVEQIDRTTGVVAVAGEAVPGWMMAMTMSYYLEPAEVLEELEPGDRITAKVYSGDFQHLYEVQVVREPVAGAR
jgi:Cu/Ag efflux protein CusF